MDTFESKSMRNSPPTIPGMCRNCRNVLVSQQKQFGVSSLQAACYRCAVPFRYGRWRVFDFFRCGGTGEKMLVATVDGTMVSGLRGGIAREDRRNRKATPYASLALMHAPVSHQQETPVPCRKRKDKNTLHRPPLIPPRTLRVTRFPLGIFSFPYLFTITHAQFL